MANLPEQFLTIMKRLLQDDYDTFLESYDRGREYGLRVNTAKISTEEFERIAPFHLTKVPWIENGYFYEEEDYPARHPFYAAGLYYLQEPSAMTPASRLPVLPGDRVMDTCAAPGGKATALGAKLQGQGLIVANDINTARGKALLRNIELFGFDNAFVVNEPPYKVAERLPQYFDKVMVDAPCSGEGMFRKNPSAVDNWLEKGPEYFSKLQQEITLAAADLLKPGGMMFYSTCTFSPLENEGTIAALLKNRPEMEVVPMEDFEGFSAGFTGEDLKVLSDIYPELSQVPEECSMTRRIWPHKMNGEGHYLALLRKKAQEDYVDPYALRPEKKKKGKKGKKDFKSGKSGLAASAKNGKTSLSKEQKKAFDEFFSIITPKLDESRIDIRGDKVYYIPELLTDDGIQEKIQGLHFLRNGIYLGDLKKNRFEPSQPYALTLKAENCLRTMNFRQDDPRLDSYLKGEPLEVGDLINEMTKEGLPCANGWYLVAVEGYGLGFGKLAGNTLKNKYPVGWRNLNI